MRLDAFFARIDGRLQAILFEEVQYIRARKNYAEVITTMGKIFLYVSIKCLEEKLPENLFCRIHRSCIVSIQKISSLDHHYVYVQNQKLPLSQQYYENLVSRLIIICSENDAKLKHEMDGLSVQEYLKKARKKKTDK